MNTANLQLEGLYLALAALTQALVKKGVFTTEEIEGVLRGAEATAATDAREADLSPANMDAICFPIRLLRMANNAAGNGSVPTFSELARAVGSMKDQPDIESPI